MKRIISTIIAVGIACASLFAQGNCFPTHSLSNKDLAFKGGEKYSLVFHYVLGPVNADVCTATIATDSVKLNGQSVYKTAITAKIPKMYESLFKIIEEFTSWYTCDGLKPVRFYRYSMENKYTSTNNYTYFSDHIHAELENSRNGKFSKDLPVSACLSDIPRLFSIVRNADKSKLVTGKSYNLTFAIDDQITNAKLTYLGKENKKVKGLGTVSTLKFKLSVAENEIFDDDQANYIWFTDDANMLPVSLSVPMKVGRVTGRLKSYENLKYNFTSIVK